MKLKQLKNQGFTIIEVLIVLAIAGLIMLIVFLAVPALQRNSRNTQRKNDISGLLGAVQEVLNNNGGKLTELTSDNITAAAPKPAYYTYSSTNPADAAQAGAAGVTNATDIDKVAIYYNAVCSGANIVQGTTRQIAIIYKIEPAVFQCTNS